MNTAFTPKAIAQLEFQPLDKAKLPNTTVVVTPLPIAAFIKASAELPSANAEDARSINAYLASSLRNLHIMRVSKKGNAVEITGKATLNSHRYKEPAITAEVGVRTSPTKNSKTLVEKVEASLSIWYPNLSRGRASVRRIGIVVECSPKTALNGSLPMHNSKIQIQFGLNDLYKPEQTLTIAFIQEPGRAGCFFIVKPRTGNDFSEDDDRDSPVKDPSKQELKATADEVAGYEKLTPEEVLAKLQEGSEPAKLASRRRFSSHLNDIRHCGELKLSVPYEHLAGNKERNKLQKASSRKFKYDPTALISSLTSIFEAERSTKVDLDPVIQPIIDIVRKIGADHFSTLEQKAQLAAAKLAKAQANE